MTRRRKRTQGQGTLFERSSWEMRTNIKAQPGSQGTLFQGGADQMTDAKWPRGYTPERLHQVLPLIAPDKDWLRDRPMGPPWDLIPDRRKLVDTVARSTVPAAHLRGVQFSAGRRMLDMELPEGEYATGTYTPQEGSFLPHIQIAEMHSGNSTPIHEIGHHVSHQRGLVSYETPGERGHEEGLADAYAQEHFRDRRGRPGVEPTYAGGQMNEQRPEAFYNSYHAARGNPQDYDRNYRATEAYIQDFEHARDNPTLFEPPDQGSHRFGPSRS
jgi:hypothetical protein